MIDAAAVQSASTPDADAQQVTDAQVPGSTRPHRVSQGRADLHFCEP